MTNQSEKSILVWDSAVRSCHWSVVILFAALWWTAENKLMDLHRYAGYAMQAVLVFRLYWGVAGATTARFAFFIRSPATIWRYSRTLWQRQVQPSFGHNPLGGLSAVLMLLLLVLQVISGLFAVDVDGWEAGPLSTYVSFDSGRWFADWHQLLFNLLLLTVGIHIAAVLYYLYWRKQNLIAAMLSGRSALLTQQVQRVKTAGVLHYLVGIALAMLSVWWFI